MKTMVSVMVGEGVFVPRGVGVKVSVGVDVGIARAVCVDAAFAVLAMIWSSVPGSSVGGTDGAELKVGAHAMTRTSAKNHNRYFVLRFNIHPYKDSNVNSQQ